MEKNIKRKKRWWKPSEGLAIAVSEDDYHRLQAGEREVSVILQINENTDVSISLKTTNADEKVIKVSKAWKTTHSWFDTLFRDEPRYYYRFLCLTTHRLCLPIVSLSKFYTGWHSKCEDDFNIPIRPISLLTSVYAQNGQIVINRKVYTGESYQIKYPVSNPEEWVKEINAVIKR